MGKGILLSKQNKYIHSNAKALILSNIFSRFFPRQLFKALAISRSKYKTKILNVRGDRVALYNNQKIIFKCIKHSDA